MKFVIFLSLIISAFAVNVPHNNDFIIQKREIGSMNSCSRSGNCVSHDFIMQEKATPEELETEMLTIPIAIEQPAAACDAEIIKVSYPDSPEYGNYLSREQVRDLMSNIEATKTVEEWLTKNNVEFTTSFDGGFIRATTTLKQWESLLDASFYKFYSKTMGKSVFRTTEAFLPIKIAEHVEFLGALTSLPYVNKIGNFFSASNSRIRQANTVTPQLISKTYNIKNNTVNNRNMDTGATSSIFESLGQEFSPADLTTFDNNYNVPPQKVAKVIGKNVPSDCVDPNNCDEANLDVQWFTAVAQFSPVTYWSIPSTGDIFLDWIDKIAAMPHPPLVHSVSYGGPEAENQQSIVKRFNTEVCKMGLRGLTVMIAAGDDGVAGAGARGNPSGCGFNPDYPATCPYVTAVGATQGPEAGKPERVCASDAGGLITSGGGFSGVFNTPSWQLSAVSTYLKNGPNLPPTSMFNAKGRGYPDVADLGHNYPIVIDGSTYVGSGTSASSPVFASMVTLINDARITAGKPSVGFINPALYVKFGAGSSVYNDITVGENNCAAGTPPSETCCQYGFNATSGWDPASGYGSPHFEAMKEAFLKL